MILLASAACLEALVDVSQRLVVLGYESRCISGIRCPGELPLLLSQGPGSWALLLVGFGPAAGFVYLALRSKA